MMKPSELSPVTDGGKPVWEKAKPLHHRKSEWQVRLLKNDHFFIAFYLFGVV